MLWLRALTVLPTEWESDEIRMHLQLSNMGANVNNEIQTNVIIYIIKDFITQKFIILFLYLMPVYEIVDKF